MLTMTEAASRKLAEIIARQPEPVFGLRVSAQDGGCGCHQYALSLAREVGPGDWVGEFGGVKVLVDGESAPDLRGVNIDYVETAEAAGFAVTRPNPRRGCGCRGESCTDESGDASAGGGQGSGGGPV